MRALAPEGCFPGFPSQIQPFFPQPVQPLLYLDQDIDSKSRPLPRPLQPLTGLTEPETPALLITLVQNADPSRQDFLGRF